MTPQEKSIEDIPVSCVIQEGHPVAVAGEAFRKLEQVVSLKGNKFYGVFDGSKNKYSACVATNETNRETVRDLHQGIIPRGTYGCVTITGSYEDIIRQIGPAFDLLRRTYQHDPLRPDVEFYKRHTEVIVMLPIRK